MSTPVTRAGPRTIALLSSACAGSTRRSDATRFCDRRLQLELGSARPSRCGAARPDMSCAGYLKRATAALDTREPGHPAVVSVAMYADGSQPAPIDVTGDATPPMPAPTHAGPAVTVFVFTLADGSTRATGVACVDGSPPSCVGSSAGSRLRPVDPFPVATHVCRAAWAPDRRGRASKGHGPTDRREIKGPRD